MKTPACNNCQARRQEEFVRWFLRFNGFFGIESFIVHRVTGDHEYEKPIPSDTEADVLAIRLPFSKEEINEKQIPLFQGLVEEKDSFFDVVIAEVGGGKKSPNKIWNHKLTENLDWRKNVATKILQFIGLFESESLDEISREILEKYKWSKGNYRVRYIIFSEKKHRDYESKLLYITFDEMIEFLVRNRNCYEEDAVAYRSHHRQWSKLINALFESVNLQTTCGAGDAKYAERKEDAMKSFNQYIASSCVC